ncbi:hypothetical protein J437_LFUL017877 [Ladona fulva]|uniref:Uncharacterized protein n=1 Tax=Ladona fulva TaxID=123851 RepID=A0A8K0KPU4_LADFU|nr:hypothetical protein J437_LFUL017877 [Ladona fulva]
MYNYSEFMILLYHMVRLCNESKILMLKMKEIIQKPFRKKMGLIVDVPKPDYGTSYDGCTARRFYADPKLASEVTSQQHTSRASFLRCVGNLKL